MVDVNDGNQIGTIVDINHGGNIKLVQGCILNLKVLIFPPPPILIYIFSPPKSIIMRGCALCNFVHFSQLGKKYAYFLPIGEKICIFLLFYIFSIIFFPQPVIWPYFCPQGGGGSNKKIYTPKLVSTIYTPGFMRFWA